MKKVTLVDQVSFEVKKGQTIGLLGPNGAGKTSLIHLIVGIRRPDNGQILVDGNDAASAMARRKIGYLPERPYFYDHMTARQLLEAFGRLSELKQAGLTERIQTVLRRVRLAHAEHRELRKFSKGMLQRFGVAQAILHNPYIVILDEPMSGLDPAGRLELKNLIRELKSQGKTILFSSHVLSDVEDLCDQALLIKNGKKVAQQSMVEIQSKLKLKGTVTFAFHDKSTSRLREKFNLIQVSSSSFQYAYQNDTDLTEFLKLALECRDFKILSIQKSGNSLEAFFGDHSL